MVVKYRRNTWVIHKNMSSSHFLEPQVQAAAGIYSLSGLIQWAQWMRGQQGQYQRLETFCQCYHDISGASGSKTAFDSLAHTVLGKDIYTNAGFCWEGWSSTAAAMGSVPFLQSPGWSVRSPPSSPPKKPAEEEGNNDDIHRRMKSGEREPQDPACVRGFSLTPCYAVLSDQAFRSNAWVPDLLRKPQLPSLHLPPLPKWGHKSPHFLLGHKTKFPPIREIIWERTSLLEESPLSPGSSSSSSLPEISVFMWDQHAGPNAFPLASERSGWQYIESLNILIIQLC